jgi:twitching motility protein PilT
MPEEVACVIDSKKYYVDPNFDINHRTNKIDIDKLLTDMVVKGASDLHLKSPTGPVYRIDGELDKQDSFEVTPQDIENVFHLVASDAQQTEFYAHNEVDFSYSIAGVARFRVNVHRQRGSLSIVFRMIPFKIPTIDELGLPRICKDLIMKPRGLIVVTGPTGSGKSSTLAAMVQYLNNNANKRIITIEDPIEFIFKDERCVISQRELGSDTESFALALKHALRHDPDVIIVGEMRDLETMATAVAAAETGHLVLGTLHTIDAAQTVDRLIDMFPPTQHVQMKLQFSQLLEAVICQTLVPKAKGHGRIGAFEIMTGNTATRNLIREGKTHELNGVILMNQYSGMQTLDMSLATLVNQGLVKKEDAILKTSHPDLFTKMLSKTYM